MTIDDKIRDTYKNYNMTKNREAVKISGLSSGKIGYLTTWISYR